MKSSDLGSWDASIQKRIWRQNKKLVLAETVGFYWEVKADTTRIKQGQIGMILALSGPRALCSGRAGETKRCGTLLEGDAKVSRAARGPLIVALVRPSPGKLGLRLRSLLFVN